MSEKRVFVFVGAYGSGKTEVAINYALHLNKEGKQVVMVDLDLVTPYFRSREAACSLREKGIEVLAPPRELSRADLPILPPGITSVLKNKGKYVILDVGGDPTGARVLGTLQGLLPVRDLEVFYVVNARRPFTREVDQARDVLERIEASSRVKATALVNNTHLGDLTNPEVVLEGGDMVRELAMRLGLPVKITAVKKDLASLIPNGHGVGMILPLTRHMCTPWDEVPPDPGADLAPVPLRVKAPSLEPTRD